MRYTKDEKEWFRYLKEVLESDAPEEDKKEARELLRRVDHRVFNGDISTIEDWRDVF